MYFNSDGTPHPVHGALQLVFCDVSTPNSDGRWNAYDALRAELVEKGIPRSQIRYIHDADSDEKKGRLFKECRDGGVSVLIGSTARMGTGVNVQQRCIAMTALDPSFRPCDEDQRAGRLLRQGCLHKEVEIVRVVAEGSFDVYMYQMLERKQGFVSQILRNNLECREIEDIDTPQMSYAELKAIASGDSRIMDKAAADMEVARLQRLMQSYDQTMWRLRSVRHSALKEIETLHADIANLDRSIHQRRDTMGDAFAATIGGKRLTERRATGEGLITGARAEATKGLGMDAKGLQGALIASIGGFSVRAVTGGRVGRGRAEVILNSPYPIIVGMVSLGEEIDPLGIIRGVEHKLRSFEFIRSQAIERITHLTAEAANADRQLSTQWEHADKLTAALERQAEIESLFHLATATTAVPEHPPIIVETERQVETLESAVTVDLLLRPHLGTVAASTVLAAHSAAPRPRRSVGLAL